MRTRDVRTSFSRFLPRAEPRWAVLAMILCGACTVPAVDEETSLGTTSSALTDEKLLTSVPGIAAPAGFGNYCSVTDPTNGGYALLLRGAGSDPCGELRTRVGAAAVIRRAGLWSLNGNNNAMVRCDAGVLSVRRDVGDVAVNQVLADAARVAGKSCYFVITPTRLPAFGFPYDPSATVTSTTVFGYDFPGTALNTGDYGRFPASPVCEVDRTGFGSLGCNAPRPPQLFVPTFGSNEGAYDWSMARDTPLLAVADGIVRGAQSRPTGIAGQTEQLELFLETQVGTGTYAEHFVAAYHHMEPAPLSPPPTGISQTSAIAQHLVAWNAGWAALGQPALALAPPGTVVKRGDVIGYVGTTGNSSAYHLDLSVHHLTNITDARAYVFQSSPTKAVFANGINGWPGQIDPFGWAAPNGIDPLAYRFMDKVTDTTNPIHLGAYSINLWLSPDPNTDKNTLAQWPLWPPTNGGASW